MLEVAGIGTAQHCCPFAASPVGPAGVGLIQRHGLSTRLWEPRFLVPSLARTFPHLLRPPEPSDQPRSAALPP